MEAAQGQQAEQVHHEQTQEQEQHTSEEEVREITIDQKQIIIEAQDKMKQNIEYSIMYQPVYASRQDKNLYVAGPLLQELPKEKNDFSKAFLDAMKKTGDAFERAWDVSKPAFIKFGHIAAEFSVKSWNSFMEAMKSLTKKNKQHAHAENDSEYQRLIEDKIVAEEIVLTSEIDENKIVHRNKNVANENTNDDSLLHLVL